MATTIIRTPLVHDTGTPAAPVGDGTLWNNTWLTGLYNAIDNLFTSSPFTFGSTITCEGFGTHLFSAGGAGANIVRVRNVTAGTSNYAGMEIGNDAATDAGVLAHFSSTYATSGLNVQDGLVVASTRVGGVSLGAIHASGVVRFYAGSSSAERAVMNSNGLRLANGYYLAWKNVAGAEHRVLTLHTDDNVFLDAPVVASNLILRTNQAFGVTEVARLTNLGSFLIGDNTNTKNLHGLTINNLDFHDEILSFKASEIAHGFTGETEPDTYGRLMKANSGNGGLAIHAFTDSGTGMALQLVGGQETADVAKSTAAGGAVVVNGTARAGTTWGTLGTNGNIVAFQDNGTTRIILDAEGDAHQDAATGWTNYDAHDDLALLTRLSAHVTRPTDPLRETFGSWLLTSRVDLERLKLVTFNDGPAGDGRAFVNMSKLTMLLVGAVRQLGGRLAILEQKALNA